MAEDIPGEYEQSTIAERHVISTVTTTASVDITCDTDYLRSIQGILKVLEIVLSIISFSVILSSGRGPSHNFFLFVTIACGVVSTCVFVLFSTKLILNLTSIPCNLMLALVYIVMSLSCTIGFILVAVNAYSPAHGSAATLGFITSGVYFVSMLLAVRDCRPLAVRDFRTASTSSGTLPAGPSHVTTEASPPVFTATTAFDPQY